MNAPGTTENPPETKSHGCCPDCHRILGRLEPYLPLLERAAGLLDNPAARWRERIRRGGGGTP